MKKALFKIFSFIFLISFIPAISKEKNDIYLYWYGFGIGSLGTICVLQDNELTKEDVILMKEGMLEDFSNSGSQKFDQEAFYQAELFVKQQYPDCVI